MAVVISSEFVLSEADAEIPLSYPRILYDDIFRDGTITASSEQTDFEAENVSDGLTWDYWKPDDLPAWIEVQTDAAEEVDYALLVHTLGSSGTTVKAQYHNGSAWVDLTQEVSPGTDRVLAFLFGEVTASRFRFYFSGENSPAELPAVKVAMMGKALAMQRGVTLNHAPITLSRRTVARPQISEGGKLLGRSILREGVATTIAFEHLEADWLRENFEPFIESARVYPFGWVWHPVSYSAEVAYVWTPAGSEDIRPEHAGNPDRMNVTFEVEGVIE